MNKARDSNYTGDVTLIPGRKNHRTLTVALPNIWLRMLECVSKLCLQIAPDWLPSLHPRRHCALQTVSSFQKLKPGERKGSEPSLIIETKSPAKLCRVSFSTGILKCGARPWQPRSACPFACPYQGEGEDVRENTVEDI